MVNVCKYTIHGSYGIVKNVQHQDFDFTTASMTGLIAWFEVLWGCWHPCGSQNTQILGQIFWCILPCGFGQITCLWNTRWFWVNLSTWNEAGDMYIHVYYKYINYISSISFSWAFCLPPHGSKRMPGYARISKDSSNDVNSSSQSLPFWCWRECLRRLLKGVLFHSVAAPWPALGTDVVVT